MLDYMMIGGALSASLGGLVLLAQGWGRTAPMRGRVAGALLLWALASALWIMRFGAEIGIPLALETAALVAFAFILTRIERRSDKPARERQATLPPKARWRFAKGSARFAVAGPLGLIAAMGIAVVIATMAPMAPQTRLILAGLIVPTLWAFAIGWVVCARRLPVQAATFTMIGMTGFGLTLLLGV